MAGLPGPGYKRHISNNSNGPSILGLGPLCLVQDIVHYVGQQIVEWTNVPDNNNPSCEMRNLVHSFKFLRGTKYPESRLFIWLPQNSRIFRYRRAIEQAFLAVATLRPMMPRRLLGNLTTNICNIIINKNGIIVSPISQQKQTIYLFIQLKRPFLIS